MNKINDRQSNVDQFTTTMVNVDAERGKEMKPLLDMNGNKVKSFMHKTSQ